MLASYANLEVFDWVHSEALWNVLWLCGISPRIMVTDWSVLWDRKCCEAGEREVLDPLNTGVRQQCILAPSHCYTYGFSTTSSCYPNSLWHLLVIPWFCHWCGNPSWVMRGSCASSWGTAWKGKVLGIWSHLGEDQGIGVWRLAGWTLESVHACSADVENLKSFIYFGCMVHDSGGSFKSVLR